MGSQRPKHGQCMSVLPISILFCPCFQSNAGPTYVDLRIFKSLLQVVIDGFVRYLADESEIRDSNFLLLGAFENGLPDLGFSPSATCRLSIAGVFLAASALCDCLLKYAISVYPRAKGSPRNVAYHCRLLGCCQSTLALCMDWSGWENLIQLGQVY